jgi:hypothetical protein
VGLADLNLGRFDRFAGGRGCWEGSTGLIVECNAFADAFWCYNDDGRVLSCINKCRDEFVASA